MKGGIKIIVVISIFVIFLIGVLFPGFFPFHFLEPVFKFSCDYVLDGEIVSEGETGFDDKFGIPVREDSIGCGRDKAKNAYQVCQLDSKLEDICYVCPYGVNYIVEDEKIIGKMCKPYRSLWKWEYKTLF